jgi:tetratricopeptide (TPR) repeat protein
MYYGGIMGLLEIFKGKDPEKLEGQGDRFFEAGAYGQARLEYESAMEKRRKETPNDTRIPGLENKITSCRESLAAEHRKRGANLADDEYFEESREYINLALDLTQNADLIDALRGDLRNIETGQAKAAFGGAPDVDNPEPEIPDRAIPEFESEDEYAEALFNTVAEEIRALYESYGDHFKKGYIALHQARFDDAVQYLSLALKENPAPDSYVRLELATAHLNLKRFEEALALLEEFAPQQWSPMKYSMLCELYWGARRFDRALELLDSIAGEKETGSFLCLFRGKTLSLSGERSQAESLYQYFLRERGWDTGIARALAETREAVGDREKARELLGRVIASCSGCGVKADPAVQRKYADLCMEAGIQDEKLLNIYLDLADKDPENAVGYYLKVSRIYDALGHEKEARRFQQIASHYEGDGSVNNDF